MKVRKLAFTVSTEVAGLIFEGFKRVQFKTGATRAFC
jgi:hypothetical protein